MAPGHAVLAENDLETVARLVGENGYFRRSASAFRAGGSHKEWLHFAIHAPGLDLLANFSIVDDIRPGVRPGTEIPRLTCLVRERSWDGDIEQFSPAEVRMKRGHLAVAFGENSVSFEDGEIVLKAKLRKRALEIDLRLKPLVVPTPAFNLEVDDCPPIHWLVVPRLSARGTVRVGDTVHELRNASAYHDHNWGHFRWGKNFAWEWGYGAPDESDNPWTMVFVRLTNRRHTSDLMQAIFLWNGARQTRLFREGELRVRREGALRCPSPFKLPRVMGLVSPGGATGVPERLVVEGRGDGDHIEFEFRCEDVGQVIIPNDGDLGVTIINEVSGRLELTGRVRGEPVRISCPSIFEFLSE
jgi:hypothetical protein